MEKGVDAEGTIPMKTVMKKVQEWLVIIGIVPSASTPFSISGTASGLVTIRCSLNHSIRNIININMERIKKV